MIYAHIYIPVSQKPSCVNSGRQPVYERSHSWKQTCVWGVLVEGSNQFRSLNYPASQEHSFVVYFGGILRTTKQGDRTCYIVRRENLKSARKDAGLTYKWLSVGNEHYCGANSSLEGPGYLLEIVARTMGLLRENIWTDSVLSRTQNFIICLYRN